MFSGISNPASAAGLSYDPTKCRDVSELALSEALGQGDGASASKAQQIFQSCSYADCAAILTLIPMGPQEEWFKEPYLSKVAASYAYCISFVSSNSSYLTETPKYSGQKPKDSVLPKLDHVSIREHNFATLNLSQKQANHSDFSGSNFSFCKCQSMNLESTNLSRTDFSNANLYKTDLAKANLSNAKMPGAFLFGVSSGGLTGRPKLLPKGYQVQAGFLLGPGVNLRNADLRKTRLQNIDLSFVDLNNSNLEGVSLAGAKLDHAWGASGIKGKPAALPKGYKLVNGTLIGPKLKSISGNLQGLNIAGMDLSDANFSSISSGAIIGTPKKLPKNWMLVHGYLIGPSANLMNADLSKQNLRGANLTGANLTGANLTGADLSKSVLKWTALRNTNFQDTLLNGVTGSHIISGLEPLNLPQGWRLWNGVLVGPGADLHGEDLQGVSFVNYLRDGGIEAANLSGLNLSGANLSGANLAHVNFSGANLFETEFNDAQLGFANFSEAVMVRASLYNASIQQTNFTRANLSGANLSNAFNGLPWWSLEHTEANFTQANLKDADLSGANLVGSIFTNADLTGAKTAGTRF